MRSHFYFNLTIFRDTLGKKKRGPDNWVHPVVLMVGGRWGGTNNTARLALSAEMGVRRTHSRNQKKDAERE